MSGSGICEKCHQPSTLLINGRCHRCKPFDKCPKCGTGTVRLKSTPNWQNCYECDECGHKLSK